MLVLASSSRWTAASCNSNSRSLSVLYSRVCVFFCFFFSSRRRHTRWTGDWSSDVCSSDLSKARPWAWLSEWGPVVPKNGGHGDLGIGILLPRDAVVDWKETSDHYMALSRDRKSVV